MDTAIVVALVTGGLGTIGAIGNIAERISNSRTTARSGDSRLELDRQIQTSADQKWMIGELKDQLAAAHKERDDVKAERDTAKDKLDAMRTDHETLQRLYRETIERLESLEMKNRKGLDE